MSGLILCRTKEAEKPYFIKDMGIRIYSLEELAYYIYNNIYILNRDFFDDALIEFIENQLCEASLAEKLRLLNNQKASLASYVITVLRYVDYYSNEEIVKLEGVFDTLNTQNVYERLKARGDNLLENGKYNSAVLSYSKILDGKRDPVLSAAFYAKVYHNMGVAYARMFLFKLAVNYFDMAYKIGQYEDSKNCLLACRLLCDDDAFNSDGDATEDEYVLKREVETLMDNARYTEDYRKLNDIDRLRDEGNVSMYYDTVSQMLDNWKNDYLKNIS